MKEILTLENVQVDCMELNNEQINNMSKIIESKGYTYNNSLYIKDDIWRYVAIVDDYTEEKTRFYFNYYNQPKKTTITYEKFMELFGNKEKSEEFNNLIEVLNEELTEEAYKEEFKENQFIAQEQKNKILEFEKYVEESSKHYEETDEVVIAYKETENKLNYELDFNFITQLAERMAQNKHKYEPYNWQKLDNIAELKQALFRHVLEVMKGNYEDDNRLFGHLESISLNAMFINYQLNNLKNK